MTYNPYYPTQPMMQVQPTMMGPVNMGQPAAYGYPYPAYPYNPYSLGSRFRQFFGFAPRSSVRYKSDRGAWGFMGYSRRQRYVDARTGLEVDRNGRQVFRV